MVALRRGRNAFIVRLSLGEFGIENLFSIAFSAREKVLENQFVLQSIPEKFPVGRFRQQKPVLIFICRAAPYT